jgi:L-serine dehydratase
LHGSFAATGQGHGTHLAIVAGLLGMAPDDEHIPNAFAMATEQGMTFRFEEVDLGDVHPNSARINLTSEDSSLELCASSLGSGRISVWDIDGFKVNLDGEYPTLLLVYPDRLGTVAVVSSILANANINIATIKAHRTERGGQALMAVKLDQIPPKGVLGSLRLLPQFEQVRLVPALTFGG